MRDISAIVMTIAITKSCLEATKYIHGNHHMGYLGQSMAISLQQLRGEKTVCLHKLESRLGGLLLANNGGHPLIVWSFAVLLLKEEE